MYRPQYTFTTPLLLLIPTAEKHNGVRTKTYPAAANGVLFYGSFKTYGGTERDLNGVYSIEDTADIETWYRPDITSDCRIALGNNPTAIYEVLGDPENIEQRNQFLKLKVRRYKGGA